MVLKFPNARLLLFDLIANAGLSGSEAIVRNACDLGVIKPECAAKLPPAICEGCQCFSMARTVFMEHFHCKVNCDDKAATVNPEDLWQVIERDFHKIKNSPATSECSKKNQTVAQCCSHAAILFDLMLQQIRRYSDD